MGALGEGFQGSLTRNADVTAIRAGSGSRLSTSGEAELARSVATTAFRLTFPGRSPPCPRGYSPEAYPWSEDCACGVSPRPLYGGLPP